jgi:hypothetical protein
MNPMWQLQYLRALEIGTTLVAEADRDRLVRSAVRRDDRRGVGLMRRAIAFGARSVERTATSVACWADPGAA